MGLYTIPAMAGVRLDEATAHEQPRDVLVGRARGDEIVRGLSVRSPDGPYPLGFHIVGEGATEIVCRG